MDDLNILLSRQSELFKQLEEIEEVYEGIDDKKIIDLNTKQVELITNKKVLNNRLTIFEAELKEINENKVMLAKNGLEKISTAIKEQRWFFFKNKPELIFDRDTGLLWPNLDYFNTNPSDYSIYDFYELEKLVKGIEINGFVAWELPSEDQLIKMIDDKTFPFQIGDNNRINNLTYWACVGEYGPFRINLDNSYSISGYFSDIYFLPCSADFSYKSYEKDISEDNKVYTEKERLQFILDLFIKNNVLPIFKDPEITNLYNKIYFEKPLLLQELSELEERIKESKSVELLSSSNDYEVLLLDYDLESIDKSIIKYYKSIISLVDELIDKVNYYEIVKKEIIQEFNKIELKLSRKYEAKPYFDNNENSIFEERKTFLEKNLKLNMNDIKKQLFSYKKQAINIKQRIDEINSRDDSIRELAILEKEDRASFKLIVENISEIIRQALLKIEFFESNRNLGMSIMMIWDEWNSDYKRFKTSAKTEFEDICKNDGIENEIYIGWFKEWKQQRLVIEEVFIPLAEYSLKGRLNYYTNDEKTILEKIYMLLNKYKADIDKFYMDTRKSLHQKFAFEMGGDLQEKVETEIQLFKKTVDLQKDFQELITQLDDEEDRSFLFNLMADLFDLPINEIIIFLETKEIRNNFMDILAKFTELKYKNYEAFILDSITYKEEMQRREDEFNNLMYRMKKGLI